MEQIWTTLITRPETMGEICAHVAGGGSLIDRCKLWGIAYGSLIQWIHDDPKRSELYARAIDAKTYYSIDRVIQELESIGTVDLIGAYDDKNNFKDIKDIPENIRRCITSIETEEIFDGVGKDRECIGHTKKIRFSDKLKAIELIGKRLAIWIDRNRIDVNNKSIEDLIHESMLIEIDESQRRPDATVLPLADKTTPPRGLGPPLNNKEGSTQ